MAEWTDVAVDAVEVGRSYNFLRDGGSRYRTMAVIARPADGLLVLALVHHKDGRQELGGLQLVEASAIQGCQTVGKSVKAKDWQPMPANLKAAQEAAAQAMSQEQEQAAS